MVVRDWRVSLLAIVVASSCVLSACTASHTEHYVSPRVQGESQKINLDEVQKAFFESQGKDFNGWMGAFEKRVNEIYDGKEVVSIDATRDNGHLVVTGYIDTQNKEGFQPGDEKLFSIEQTGDAVNNEMPYRVSGSNNVVYYEGHRSLLDNPFLQMMLISHMMGGWGGRYYTPRTQYVVLRDYRDTFRTTPAFGTQQAANRDFMTRFKTKSLGGGFESSNKFGSSGFSSTSGVKNRSWGGLGSSSSTSSFSSSGMSSSSSTSSLSSWGGRRSSGGLFGGGGGMRMRGWGGRRR